MSAAAAAHALDAADGVIDGRHFGRPIVQGGAPAFLGAQTFAPTTVFGGYPSFSGYPTAFGGFGAPAVVAGGAFGSPSAAALAADAADGVIDGKHFGRPIVQAGGSPFVQAAPVGYGYGAPTVFGGYPATAFGGYPATAFGGFAAPATVFGGASAAALAADAADGVIDGKHFGRPIVQAGGSPFVQAGGLVPYTGVQAAAPVFAAAPAVGPSYGFQAPVATSAYYGQRFAGYGAVQAAGYGYPTQYAGVPTQYAGVPTQFAGVPAYAAAYPGFGYGAAYPGSAAQRAAALDAADGVIDGKHFGRPIVQAGAPVRRF